MKNTILEQHLHFEVNPNILFKTFRADQIEKMIEIEGKGWRLPTVSEMRLLYAYYGYSVHGRKKFWVNDPESLTPEQISEKIKRKERIYSAYISFEPLARQFDTRWTSTKHFKCDFFLVRPVNFKTTEGNIDNLKIQNFMKELNHLEYVYLVHHLDIVRTVRSMIQSYGITREDFCKALSIPIKDYDNFTTGNFEYDLMHMAKINALHNKLEIANLAKNPPFKTKGD